MSDGSSVPMWRSTCSIVQRVFHPSKEGTGPNDCCPKEFLGALRRWMLTGIQDQHDCGIHGGHVLS